MKRVAGYGVHTLRVLRESRNALLRVEPRITSSLIRDGVFYFLAESVISTLFYFIFQRKCKKWALYVMSKRNFR